MRRRPAPRRRRRRPPGSRPPARRGASPWMAAGSRSRRWGGGVEVVRTACRRRTRDHHAPPAGGRRVVASSSKGMTSAPRSATSATSACGRPPAGGQGQPERRGCGSLRLTGGLRQGGEGGEHGGAVGLGDAVEQAGEAGRAGRAMVPAAAAPPGVSSTRRRRASWAPAVRSTQPRAASWSTSRLTVDLPRARWWTRSVWVSGPWSASTAQGVGLGHRHRRAARGLVGLVQAEGPHERHQPGLEVVAPGRSGVGGRVIGSTLQPIWFDGRTMPYRADPVASWASSATPGEAPGRRAGRRPWTAERTEMEHPRPRPETTELERQLRHASFFVQASLEQHGKLTGKLDVYLTSLIELLMDQGVIDAEDLAQAVDANREVHDAESRAKFETDGILPAWPTVMVRQDDPDEPVAPEIEVDCEARMHICQAVCCSLPFPLSAAEVEAGDVNWDLGHPYVIRQTAEGWCTHNDRSTGGCDVYHKRPGVCRSYSCAHDERIWKPTSTTWCSTTSTSTTGASGRLQVPAVHRRRGQRHHPPAPPAGRAPPAHDPRRRRVDPGPDPAGGRRPRRGRRGVRRPHQGVGGPAQHPHDRRLPLRRPGGHAAPPGRHRRPPERRGPHHARRQPPRFFKLSYLLTAWTQRPEDEHRLLSSLLSCFLRHDALPVDVQVGALAENDLPLPITLAIPPPEDRALSDVWSALGGELKPSLDLVVVLPWDLDRTEPTAPPVTEPPVVDMPDPVAGRVPPAAPPPAPPARATAGEARVGPVVAVDAHDAAVAAGGACRGRSLAHVLGRLAALEAAVQAAVEARRAADPGIDDPFRGLYLGDDDVDRVLAGTPRAARAGAAEPGATRPRRPRTPTRRRGRPPAARRPGPRCRARRPRRRPAGGGAGARRRPPLRAPLRLPARRRDPAPGQRRAGAGAGRPPPGRRGRPRPASAPGARWSRAGWWRWTTATGRSSPGRCGCPTGWRPTCWAATSPTRRWPTCWSSRCRWRCPTTAGSVGCWRPTGDDGDPLLAYVVEEPGPAGAASRPPCWPPRAGHAGGRPGAPGGRAAGGRPDRHGPRADPEARLAGAVLVAGPVDHLAERGPELVRVLAELGVPLVLTGRRHWEPGWSRQVPVS